MTYNISIVSILSCFMIPMSGCNAIVGNRIEQDKLSLLKENQTTKAEAIGLFGKPDYVFPGEDGTGEVFIYSYSRSEMFSFKDKELQTVTLFIDDAGIVREITVSQKH